jgi:hypothetical protein
MREIVESQLLSEPDMTVVAVSETTAGLVDDIRHNAPDFVLIGATHGCAMQPLFEERPWLRVLEIEPRVADAHLFELRPRRLHLGQVSAPELVTTIRSAAHAARWDNL